MTEDQIRAALLKTRDREDVRTQENVERMQAFFKEIPRELHQHELVTGIASLIQAGEPIHPEDHKRLTDQLAHLLREHAREHSNRIWTPGDPL